MSDLSKENQELIVFLNDLVMAILGVTILDIPENKRIEVTSKCIDIFNNYIVDYATIKYGKSEGMRIKAAQIYNDSKMFEKFQNLGPIFDEAYKSFLDNLSKQWENKEESLVRV